MSDNRQYWKISGQTVLCEIRTVPADEHHEWSAGANTPTKYITEGLDFCLFTSMGVKAPKVYWTFKVSTFAFFESVGKFTPSMYRLKGRFL